MVGVYLVNISRLTKNLIAAYGIQLKYSPVNVNLRAFSTDKANNQTIFRVYFQLTSKEEKWNFFRVNYSRKELVLCCSSLVTNDRSGIMKLCVIALP